MRDKETTPFVDYLRLRVCAGQGGAGCISFRREKFAPRGGPDGGDGGRGGHVIFRASQKLSTLLDLKSKPILKAERGMHGGGSNCYGRDGADTVAEVPLGTVVSDKDGNQLADLREDGQEWIAARGGRGGLGNAQFATATNKTPRYAQEGEEGEERALVLELKLIADAGLVGLPNAGKSTLLSKLTAATPKIAPYPFTTLSPNLGVMEASDESHITLADIPGLIEGASRGVGLGDRFLRHIERTRLLCHLIGDENGVFDPDDMLYKHELVRHELDAYSAKLGAKPELLVVTKIDIADAENLDNTLKAFRQRGLDPICVSAMSGEGLPELAKRIEAELRRIKAAEEPPNEEASDDAGTARSVD
jgi:GTP-binding protein